MTKTMSLIIMGLIVLSIATVSAANGSIWTTRNDCGNSSQNVNQYAIGEAVYINGANFASDETFDWSITGQPGGASCDPLVVVISSNYAVDSNGAFCFEAYTVQADDCGVYKVNFGGKNDNYQVGLDVPIVPEFGTVVGVLTILSAIGIFFVVRRE